MKEHFTEEMYSNIAYNIMGSLNVLAFEKVDLIKMLVFHDEIVGELFVNTNNKIYNVLVQADLVVSPFIRTPIRNVDDLRLFEDEVKQMTDLPSIVERLKSELQTNEYKAINALRTLEDQMNPNMFRNIFKKVYQCELPVFFFCD